ncbi:CHAT domain-containing protein [bacterium]|nr:CHAT domain-containing protein [bacterium]
MPISVDELYQHCEKQIVLLPGAAPLGEAISQFVESGHDERQAWLIVQLDDGGYRAVRFDALTPLVLDGGHFVLNQSLGDLDLPAVDRIVSVDDAAEMADLLSWLDDHPNATLVVIDGNRCAGLLTSTLIPKGISDQPQLHEALKRVLPQSIRLEAADLNDTDSARFDEFVDEFVDDFVDDFVEAGDNFDIDLSDLNLNMAEAESPYQVDLHTDIDFPERVQPQAEHPLVIKLTPEKPADTRVDSTVSIEFAAPLAAEVVEVRVHAPNFSERDQRWAETLDVYSFTASSPAIFVLKAPPDPGIYPIGVDFRHKDRLVGSTRFEVLVGDVTRPELARLSTRTGPSSATPPTTLSSTISPNLDAAPPPGLSLIISRNPPPPADVDLRVHLDADNVLSFTLHSTRPELNLQHVDVGKTQLNATPQHFLASLFTTLSSMALDRSATRSSGAERQLRRMGENLYLDVIPEELRRVYWDLVDLRKQGVIHSLLVTSDEPWIPWELIKPYDADNDRDDDFWAGGWQLCRWLTGPAPADPVQIQAARLIAPDLDLAFVRQEKAFFDMIRQWGVDVGAAPLQTLAEVEQLAEQGGVELVHFATHGNFSGGDPDSSVIRLADQMELNPRDLRGSFVRGLRKARPLVFLNACHTAQIGFSLTGLGGWAERMLGDVRANAFIGTLWEVNDELAAEFSETFYSALWQGSKLGEAFVAARQRVRDLQPDNSTWLAYTLYGDPNGQVKWGHSSNNTPHTSTSTPIS